MVNNLDIISNKHVPRREWFAAWSLIVLRRRKLPSIAPLFLTGCSLKEMESSSIILKDESAVHGIRPVTDELSFKLVLPLRLIQKQTYLIYP
jgi:hypothetical protein